MIDADGRTTLSLKEAIALGMTPAVHARRSPERPAILSPLGDRTFDQLNARANQLARALRGRGLGPGDAIALLAANRPEFVEVYAASVRAGLRVTPINWHLTGEEVGYIVANCEASAFFADARFESTAQEAARLAPLAKFNVSLGGAIEGFESYQDLFSGQPSHDLEDPVLGSSMLYTSGTTGRPKGVYRRKQPPAALLPPLLESARFSPADDLALCTGPLYHAAPLALNLQLPLAAGVGVLLMDRWDAEETLRLIDVHRITHTHLVPTMFHRLLHLPEEVRGRYDVGSLRWVLHGAAPCPVHVKRAMIEWLGPVIFEYYAATEGGAFFIDSHEWQRKPGSVGRLGGSQEVRLVDETGEPVDRGEIGTVYFKAPEVGRFEYFKAPEKTTSAYRGDFFTMGDMGYLDEEDYLFLTGRSAELIISGGVNVYPAEIDAVLLMHPAVADVATVGVPSEEWGEEVKAVVLPAADASIGDDLAQELLEHCRTHLAHYKCPRSVDFADELPRLPTGKIQRRRVRERYWADQSGQI